jgi:cytochrome P450
MDGAPDPSPAPPRPADRLFSPEPPPPPLARLERRPLLRRVEMLRAVWRAGDNLLEMFHPEIEGRRWHVADIGATRLVTVNDPDLARHVLSDGAERFVKGHMYRALLGDFLGEASLLMNGEAARRRRRLLAPAFNARALRRLEAVVDAHVARLIGRWRAAGPGATVDLSREAPMFAMGVAMEAFFSASLGAEAAATAARLDRVMTEAGTPSMADVMDLPGWVPRRSRRALRADVAALDAALYPLIDARMARRGEGAPQAPDMLDLLVHAVDEDGRGLTRREVRDEVMTLFMAGHETTALSLAWGLDRLAREPRALAEAAAAARAAAEAAGGAIGAAAARGLAPLARAYEEMLRLYPPAYAVARTAVQAHRFEDFDVRPGDRFQIAIFMIHRNRRWWDDPGAFRPERFAAPPRHPFAFLAFGGGLRMCLGMAIARLEAAALLGATLAAFDIEAVGDAPSPLGKATLRTRAPVRLRLHPRDSESDGIWTGPTPETSARC